MKGSPHKMGGIQGTSSHSSALKQKKELSWMDKLAAARRAVSESEGPFSDSNFWDRYKNIKAEIRKTGERGSDNFKTG